MSPYNLLLFVALLALFTSKSLSLHHGREHISNITVIGSVFCDICSNNTFSNHSYFLQGAKVQVDCNFRTTSSAKEEVSILVERTTDKFGIYRVDIPPVDGFECRVGRVFQSFCRARLIQSSSPLCNVPGLISSTEHLAIKTSQPNICVYNLNALNYRPAKKDSALCGEAHKEDQSLSSGLDSSLFFWPPFFPPFGFPWPPFPNMPPFPFPFPFPFQSPPSFPFPLPPWLPFSQPPSLPFPFFPAPNPPAFPLPFPFPPFPPSMFPQSPPPSFPFPFPFTPSPAPPSPSPPSFPFPFPPFVPQLPPSPVLAPPSPPPAFSLWDPRTWFRFPPSPPDQP